VSVVGFIRGKRQIRGSRVEIDRSAIGKIDDILVSSDGKEPYAVISVGSFLGMGGRLIIVRYDSLKLAGNKVVLANGTKEGLKALPEFNYAVQ
jgi:hypothetical protein